MGQRLVKTWLREQQLSFHGATSQSRVTQTLKADPLVTEHWQ